MRKQFDDKAVGRDTSPPAPTEKRFINHPEPVPSPSGGPSVQHRKLEDVPAKDWAAPSPEAPQVPSAHKDWEKLNEPARLEPQRNDAGYRHDQQHRPSRS